jgi:hypothetical protein
VQNFHAPFGTLYWGEVQWTHVNQKPDSPRASILKTISLLFSLDEVAIKRSFENWRVKACHAFMNIQWFFSVINTSIKSYDILRISGTISMSDAGLP